MNLLRWTDDRLDDLHATVKANDIRIDHMEDSINTNDHRLRDLEVSRRATSDARRFTLMFWAAMLSPVATIMAVLIHH